MENRLITEQRNLRKNRKYLFYAQPFRNAKTGVVWECGFPGPDTELYAGSYYVVHLIFSKTYPYSPPKAVFKNSVYHPNVYADNSVCLDVISSKWKPSMNVSTVLCALQQLLEFPNIKSPANTGAAHSFRTKNAEYNKKVKNNILKFHSKPHWKKMIPSKK
ncbi:Sumo-conjugating enzyme ubc9 [Nosema granulosis]|uniref:Sumo-conjugating enzyme ubc9 n=1 Tax=Nosema granulosis TaxID=83296 RepID=A0A9P6KYL4_9MICR|nr:Sumo-conjugating enzyme ubc9 [Nosema granulosis]